MSPRLGCEEDRLRDSDNTTETPFRTPGLGHSPVGTFDPERAIAALGVQDEEALVASLLGIKWGKTSECALSTLEEALVPGSENLWAWASRLARRPEPQARGTAAPLFRHYWPTRPTVTHDWLLRLADDDDWWVREEAHLTVGLLLLEHYDQVYPILVTWVGSSSANVRRAVTLAARTAGTRGDASWAEPLLDLIQPLLADRTEYVRKNLGPYAIGDGLLRCHPDPTLARLTAWADDRREGVRWNVAMAFRSSGGTRNIKEALPILTQLAADERRFVWRAAASALHYLGKRHPRKVRPLLQGWLDDGRRRRAAEAALRHIPEPADES